MEKMSKRIIMSSPVERFRLNTVFVKRRYKDLGFTLTSLIDAVGVSRNTLYRMLYVQSYRPSFVSACALAEALSCKVDDFVVRLKE